MANIKTQLLNVFDKFGGEYKLKINYNNKTKIITRLNTDRELSNLYTSRFAKLDRSENTETTIPQ